MHAGADSAGQCNRRAPSISAMAGISTNDLRPLVRQRRVAPARSGRRCPMQFLPRRATIVMRRLVVVCVVAWSVGYGRWRGSAGRPRDCAGHGKRPDRGSTSWRQRERDEHRNRSRAEHGRRFAGSLRRDGFATSGVQRRSVAVGIPDRRSPRYPVGGRHTGRCGLHAGTLCRAGNHHRECGRPSG